MAQQCKQRIGLEKGLWPDLQSYDPPCDLIHSFCRRRDKQLDPLVHSGLGGGSQTAACGGGNDGSLVERLLDRPMQRHPPEPIAVEFPKTGLLFLEVLDLVEPFAFPAETPFFRVIPHRQQHDVFD
jgi:hypothetical protein